MSYKKSQLPYDLNLWLPQINFSTKYRNTFTEQFFMKKLSLRNKFSKYIHKSFQKWPFLVQVGSKAQQPPRSPILGHFGDENTDQATALRGPRGSPARKTYHLEGNCKFGRTRVSTSASYDPPKTTSPRSRMRDGAG